MRAKLIVADSSRNSDLLWATQFYAPDPFVFAETDDARFIAVNALEYERARKESRNCEVLLLDDLIGKNPLTLSAITLTLLRKFEIVSCTVAPNFPARIYENLKSAGIAIEFTDSLFPARAVKRPDEIEDIVHAQHACEAGFKKIVEILAKARIDGDSVVLGGETLTSEDETFISEGETLTSEMLRRAFDLECVARDCTCDATIVASGDQAADPHCLGFGPIRPNSLIVCDMFPRSKKRWYWSDMTRTVVKGKADMQARWLYGIVLEAQERALEMVRPGIDGFEIDAWIRQFFESKGYPTGMINGVMRGFFHGTGHGVGLDIHEMPRVSKIKGQILEPGNVITIEPGLYYPGIGGARVEDTVLVTEHGFENLARTPKALLQIP
ncbi:MAG: Xaa-Pro peptidase family protein [bacterium]|nr:Xaa-Pro peptidase family protein [bacterium]